MDSKNCSNCRFCKRYLCLGCVCKHPKHDGTAMPDFASCEDFEPKIDKNSQPDWSWMFPPEHPQ